MYILWKHFLSNLAHVVTTEVNTGAVEEAEITALLTHQVTVKKVVAMTQEVMNLVHPEVILLQEMIITLVVVAALQEAVLHLLPTRDMLAKSAKRFET